MARTVKDTRMDTRAARERLATREEPYWRLVSEGAHIGYSKGKRGGYWVARHRPVGHTTGGYVKTRLGEADDMSDADGDRFLTFKQAQAAARTWFDAITAGDRPAKAAAQPYTVGEALDDYLAQFTGKSLSATRSRADAIIRPELGQLDTAKLTAAKLGAWLRSRAEAPARLRTAKGSSSVNVREAVGDEAVRRRRSTANRDFTVLKAALNVAFREGKIASDEAWRKVRPFRNVDGAKARYLSDAEVQRLANACDPAFRPMVQAAVLTGARYGDLAKAKVRDLDAASATLWLPDGKGGRPRAVYLESEGAELFAGLAAGRSIDAPLLPRPDGGRWKASEQQRYLAAAWENGKVERATFHDLRRTYGARLARKGVPMAVIAEALGHADQRITTKHYAHLAPSYVSATIREHAAGLGIVGKGNVRALG